MKKKVLKRIVSLLSEEAEKHDALKLRYQEKVKKLDEAHKKIMLLNSIPAKPNK